MAREPSSSVSSIVVPLEDVSEAGALSAPDGRGDGALRNRKPRRDGGAGASPKDEKPMPIIHKIATGVLLLALLSGIVLMSISDTRKDIINGANWLKTKQTIGPLLYAPVFAVGAVVCAPEIGLAAASGYLFGLWRAALATWAGGMLGACIAFGLGRLLLRDAAQRTCLKKSATLRHMDAAITKLGWKLVLLMRLPYVPFVYLNYILAATSISFRGYFAATAIGIVPGSLLYSYVGTSIQNLEAYFSGDEDVGPVPLILTVAGVSVATATFCLLGCHARRQVRRATEAAVSDVSDDESGADSISRRSKRAAPNERVGLLAEHA